MSSKTMHDGRIKILLIQDYTSESALIEEMLSQAGQTEFSLHQVHALEKGLELLDAGEFDVVLVDLGLPDEQGLETVLKVRDHSGGTPVVVLTHLDDENAALTLLQMGIQDYLIKGEITGRQLKRSIRYAVQRRCDTRSIQESEARYRALFNAIDEGFCIIEVLFDENSKPVDYRFLEVNPSFERQTGLVNAQGARIREFAPMHEEHWFETYGKVALDGEPVRFQNWAEELHRWYDVFAFRFGEPEKRQVAVLFKDITESKQAEEEIVRLNNDLLSRAAELESANRDLEAFNYTVAHDLRQPLSVVNSYCQALEMLCGDQLSADCREYVERAYRGTLRMNSLIDALLNFSRLARAELRRETVDLSGMARDVAEELKLSAPERQVDFRIRDGIVADGDASQLRVVLDNLIGNAWKYTGMREEAVIEFDTAEADGKRAYLVRDNGAGFDKRDGERLFLPFQRLPNADQFRGFGIGLATVRRIIERHGGRIWAVGELDKGATFYFTL